jgi:hypothetical protein
MLSFASSKVRFGSLFLAFVAGSALAIEACSNDEATPIRDAAPPGLVELEASVVDASRVDASDARADVDPCEVSAPPICSPTSTWGTPVPVFPGADRRFAAISPDELHLAYYDVAASTDAGASALVRIADRSSATAPFAATVLLGQEVDTGGVGLSPDGLTAVVTKSGRPQLVLRPNVSAPFAAATAMGIEFGEESFFRAPVMASDSGFFLTLVYVSIGQVPFTFATKVGGAYRQTELLVPAPELLVRSSENLVPRPTGMSKDLRTLFYFDEATKTEKAAFRAAPGCPYKTFVDLGNRPGAQPNAACTALYYADPDVKTGSNIVRVEKNP